MKKVAFSIILVYSCIVCALIWAALNYPFGLSTCVSEESNEINLRFEDNIRKIASQDSGVFMEDYVKAFIADTESSILFLNPCENFPAAMHILKSPDYSSLEKKATIIYMYKLKFPDYMKFSEYTYSLFKQNLISPENMVDVLNPWEGFKPTISDYRWSPKWRHFMRRVKEESKTEMISEAVDANLSNDILN